MKDKRNILLINPLRNKLVQEYEAYPSGALVLIGTMLDNLGHNVKIIHMLADGMDTIEIKKTVADFNPDVVGITMNSFQTKCAKEISRLIKEVDKHILVAVGGPHPSALKSKIFNDFPHIDVAIMGEGEHTFLELAEGKDLKSIDGICYENRMNKPRVLANNLDYIPLPNLDLVNFKKFHFLGLDPLGAYPAMYLMGTRGCPYECIFCNKSVWGNTIRFRRPELVVEEIKWLRESYGVREVYFSDDTFNLNRRWVERVFNLIIENGLNKGVVYKATFRANEQMVDKELLLLAKEAGVWLILYGVENGNQEMLNRMKKRTTIREVKRAFGLTHEVGLKTTGSFIIGLPGENRETVRDTFNLQKTLNPYTAGYSPALPFPSTEFEKTVTEKGHLLVTDYDEYSPEKVVVRTDSLLKEELEYYCRRIPNVITTARKLKHRIADWNYLKRMIVSFLKNPAVTFRRVKNIYNTINTSITHSLHD